MEYRIRHVLKEFDTDEMINKYHVFLWKKEWLKNKKKSIQQKDKKINKGLFADDKNMWARQEGKINVGIDLAEELVQDNERIMRKHHIKLAENKEAIRIIQ